MKMSEVVLFIGLGFCGGKNAKLASENGFEAMAINGSLQDNRQLGNMKNIYTLNNFDGFGGRRESALDALMENMEILEKIKSINSKIVFVMCAAGGSTGTGLLPYIIEQLKENDDSKIICPVIFLPTLNEPIGKHINAYQMIQDLQDIDGLGATFFINNEVGNGDLNYINTTFSKLITTFLTDESSGEKNNLDTAEKIEILKQSGSCVISLTGHGKHDKAIELLSSNGIFAPIQKDAVCGHIGIIHSEENDINSDELIAVLGKPMNLFEGYGSKNTCVIASGMTYPIDHISKIGQLAKQGIEERQRNVNGTKRLQSIDFSLMEEKKTKTVEKKMSKLELLRQLQAK